MMEYTKKHAEKPHILIVDDDDRIRDLLFRFLMQNDMIAVAVDGAQTARETMAALSFDLIVLDIMMPEETGIDLTRSLRATGNDIPILLLTAMGDVEDRIAGLEAGADDYMVKPFEPRELKLRIEAILKRLPTPDPLQSIVRLGEWTIDLTRDEMISNETGVQKLTLVEVKLLRALLSNIGIVMSRDDLANAVGVNPDERTIDVQITRLRRTLNDDPKSPRFIATIRSQGYQLMADHVIMGGK